MEGNFEINNYLDKTKKIRSSIIRFYDITEEEFFSTTRTKSVAEARQVFFYYLRESFKISFSSIGKIFSKDHTTISYAYKKIKEEISKNNLLDNFIDSLLNDESLSNIEIDKMKDVEFVKKEYILASKQKELLSTVGLFKKRNCTYNLPIVFNQYYLDSVFSKLENREKEIFINRYGFRDSKFKTLEAIGCDNNISRERTRQIIYSMIKRMFLNNYNEVGQIIQFSVEKIDKYKLVPIKDLAKEVFIISSKDELIGIKFLLSILSIVSNIKKFELSGKLFLIDINNRDTIFHEIDNVKSLIKKAESNISEFLLIKNKKDYILNEIKKDKYFLDKPQFRNDYFTEACYDNYLFESNIITYKNENLKKYNSFDADSTHLEIKGVPKEYNIFFR